MEAELKFVIPALLGVESLVAREVKKLGLAEVRAENGRVLCSGGLGDIPRLNLNLRVGARVLLCLGEFEARSFEELFEGHPAGDGGGISGAFFHSQGPGGADVGHLRGELV